MIICALLNLLTDKLECYVEAACESLRRRILRCRRFAKRTQRQQLGFAPTSVRRNANSSGRCQKTLAAVSWKAKAGVESPARSHRQENAESPCRPVFRIPICMTQRIVFGYPFPADRSIFSPSKDCASAHSMGASSSRQQLKRDRHIRWKMGLSDSAGATREITRPSIHDVSTRQTSVRAAGRTCGLTVLRSDPAGTTCGNRP